MSQLEHKVSKEVAQLMEQHSGFRKAFPHLYGVVVTRIEDFNGLSLFIGKSGDWLCMVKRFGPDGTPQVLFSAGQTAFDALTNADRAINGDRWKVDEYRI